MSDKQKSSKAGRQAKSPQNAKYKNERRRDRNKLIRLQRHIRHHGVTAEVKERIRLLQIALGYPLSDLKVDRPFARSRAAAEFYRGPFATSRPRQMRLNGVIPKNAAA